MERRLIGSGYASEQEYGYSRAVRFGPMIAVSGTTARGEDLALDAYGQGKAALALIEAALQEAGAELRHVLRTVAYVTDFEQLDGVSRAHAEAFADIRPASTVVQVVSLSPPSAIVEFEVTAFLHDD